MKRRVFCFILIGAFFAFLTGAVMAQPAEKKVYKWKFQSHWPAGSASFKPLKDYFDKQLSKMTNGQLLITLHPAGTLVPSNDIFGACRKGTIEGGTASPIYWMSIVPITSVASNCPMTFPNAKAGLDFHFKQGFEKMLKDAHLKHGILYYTEKIYPTAMMGKKPINKLDDFKGYKIRSSGMIADMLKELGASTSMIPGSELYLALQTGVIDGAHWGAAGGALTMKLCEVAKYYIQPDLAMSGTDVIVINKEAFEALPKNIQTILDNALKKRVYDRSMEYEKEEVVALNTMINKYGVKVSKLGPTDQKKMRAVAMKQWEKAAAMDAETGKAIAMLKAYLKKIKYID